jgi:hypothetical protein
MAGFELTLYGRIWVTPKAQKHVERVAERAAEKASHTEQSYDQDHPIISK